MFTILSTWPPHAYDEFLKHVKSPDGSKREVASVGFCLGNAGCAIQAQAHPTSDEPIDLPTQ
jgi:hypothetical protein